MEKRSLRSDSDQNGSIGIDQPEGRQRYRIRYSKRGNICFIGHRDIMRTMERLFRRAHLTLAMSQGFHPKPRISYLSVLTLGFTSEDEVFDFILENPVEEKELLVRLNQVTVEGILFHSVTRLTEEEGKTRPTSFLYRMEIPESHRERIAGKIEDLLLADTLPAVKANGKTIDVRASMRKLSIDKRGYLDVVLAVQEGPEASVREILLLLELEKELFRSIFPLRVQTIFPSYP